MPETLIKVDLSASAYENDMIHNRWHPDIPMVATGHETVYEWSCKGKRAVAGKQVMQVDPRGYIADNWKVIH